MHSTGQSLGSYTIVRPLSSGRLVDVYEAVHTEYGRRVALRILSPRLQASADSVARFVAEYRAVNCLVHPAVAETYECGRLPDGSAFAATELVAGEPLGPHLDHGLTLQHGLRIARQLASILTTAHASGIVHRDLQPDHVLVSRDQDGGIGERLWLLDFGIGRIAELSATDSLSAAEGDKRRYVAPEQRARDAAVGPKADVYALGRLLTELLLDRPPHGPAGPSVGDAPRPAPHEVVSTELSAEGREALSLLIDQMLADDPERRPSMQAVCERLEQCSRNLSAAPGRSTRGADERGSEDEGGAELLGAAASPTEASSTTTDTDASADGVGPVQPEPATDKQPRGASVRRLAYALTAAGLALGLLAAGLAWHRWQDRRLSQAQAVVSAGVSQPVLASLLTVIVDPVASPPSAPSAPPTPEEMSLVTADLETDSGQAGRSLWIDRRDVGNGDFAAWLNRVDVTVRKARHVYLGERRVLDLRAKGGGLLYVIARPRPRTDDIAAARGVFQVRTGHHALPVRQVDLALAQAYCAARGGQLPTKEQVNWLVRSGVASAVLWGQPPSLRSPHGFRCVRLVE